MLVGSKIIWHLPTQAFNHFQVALGSLANPFIFLHHVFYLCILLGQT